MKGLGYEHFAGTRFSFYIYKAEMGRGAAHSGKEVLHDEAAAHHGTEHPAFRLNSVGLEVGEIQGGGCLGFGDLLFTDDGNEVHGTFRPVGDIGRKGRAISF
jgi:hypothetical protein